MISAAAELTTGYEWGKNIVAGLGKYTHRNLMEILIGKKIKTTSGYK